MGLNPGRLALQAIALTARPWLRGQPSQVTWRQKNQFNVFFYSISRAQFSEIRTKPRFFVAAASNSKSIDIRVIDAIGNFFVPNRTRIINYETLFGETKRTVRCWIETLEAKQAYWEAQAECNVNMVRLEQLKTVKLNGMGSEKPVYSTRQGYDTSV